MERWAAGLQARTVSPEQMNDVFPWEGSKIRSRTSQSQTVPKVSQVVLIGRCSRNVALAPNLC